MRPFGPTVPLSAFLDFPDSGLSFELPLGLCLGLSLDAVSCVIFPAGLFVQLLESQVPCLELFWLHSLVSFISFSMFLILEILDFAIFSGNFPLLQLLCKSR